MPRRLKHPLHMNSYRQEQTGTKILELSDFFSRLPMGRWLRNRFLRKTIRFSNQIGLNVDHLLPGHCITSLKETARIQNEHYSIHESAISALAEHAARLALLTGLPEKATASLSTFTIQHHKVAHGKIKAECRCELPDRHVMKEYSLMVTITDSAGSSIASGAATWLVNPNAQEGTLEG